MRGYLWTGRQLRLFDVFNRVLQCPPGDKAMDEARQLIQYILRCYFKRARDYPIMHLEVQQEAGWVGCGHRWAGS